MTGKGKRGKPSDHHTMYFDADPKMWAWIEAEARNNNVSRTAMIRAIIVDAMEGPRVLVEKCGRLTIYSGREKDM